MQELVLFIVGVIVSAFGTTVGFGGGVFLVPILIIFFGYNMEIAIGSAMSAMMPGAIIASLFNLRDRSIDYLVGILIQLPAMAGTVLGAFMVAFLPVQELQLIFVVFVLGIGVIMILPKKKEVPRHAGMMYRIRRAPTSFIRKNREKKLAYRLNGGVVSLFGFVSGTVAGLFGIGGGFLQTPMMIKLFRMPAQIATSTSLFILVVTSFTGFISHFLLGNVLWNRSLPLMIAFSVGSLIGNLLKKRTPRGKKLERLIAIGLLLAGTGVLLNLLMKTGGGFSF
ncbi:sulfite exporter TauE/SafE family protein [Pontibacter diazotrophicus]|uniref:Probable membrane transporter protein n=1 Tax=Pontibacter diazotrophicus TaxID=1400979 RepID=A0A3D8LI14_9BACT|nr:sulfite exporter TauE/SafE family protein [Pontibacter diazotrophicus]RDV17037.1 sulfite exporter TauE/SafE family protein [Pontibacter diazotrophicus]